MVSGSSQAPAAMDRRDSIRSSLPMHTLLVIAPFGRAHVTCVRFFATIRAAAATPLEMVRPRGFEPRSDPYQGPVLRD